MQRKIALSIAGDHLAFELLQPIKRGGLRFWFEKMAAFSLGDDRAFYDIRGSCIIPGRTDSEELESLVQAGLNTLERDYEEKIAGYKLEVELGPAHSRVGVLHIETESPSTLSTSDVESYAKAWVMHSWGLASQTQIVRYSPLEGENKFLIACIDKEVVDRINRVCSSERLKFASCKPAVVLYIEELIANKRKATEMHGSASNQPTPDVVVFAERSVQSTYSPIVQFALHNDGSLLSVSRMWLSSASRWRSNKELEAIIHRLRACPPHHDVSRYRVLTWPRVEINKPLKAQP